MRKYDLEDRTVNFSVMVIEILRKLKFDPCSSVLRSQLVRASSSIGANYSEANRAGSRRDFIYKVGISEKEASETIYWLKIVQRVFPDHSEDIKLLQSESTQLLAILTTIGKKAKSGD